MSVNQPLSADSAAAARIYSTSGSARFIFLTEPFSLLMWHLWRSQIRLCDATWKETVQGDIVQQNPRQFIPVDAEKFPELLHAAMFHHWGASAVNLWVQPWRSVHSSLHNSAEMVRKVQVWSKLWSCLLWFGHGAVETLSLGLFSYFSSTGVL